MKDKKTILITGINGFLGSHLAKSLSHYYTVIGVESSNKNFHRLKGFSFKVYSSHDNLESIFIDHKIYAIIHTATVYRTNGESFDSLLKANVILPVLLYELANKFDVSKFINTDSFFNNPKYNYKYLLDYTLSKRHVIDWLILNKGCCSLINMKIYHMYGDNDSMSKFVSQMVFSIKNNQEFIKLSLGEQKRDFVFIEDVVSAYRIVLEKRTFSNEEIVEYEVGNGKSISIKEFVETIKEITNSKTKLLFGELPYRENEIFDSVADISKLLSLGWNPKYTLEEGLKHTINSL
jgi:nucleoside-diphosphate-sugar epimerase